MAIIPKSLQPPTKPPTVQQRRLQRLGVPQIPRREEIEKEFELQQQKEFEEYKKELAKEQKQIIDKQIQEYRQKIAELQERIAQPGYTGRADEKIGELQIMIGNLHEAKQYATGEFHTSDILGYAAQRSTQHFRALESQRVFEEKYGMTPTEAIQMKTERMKSMTGEQQIFTQYLAAGYTEQESAYLTQESVKKGSVINPVEAEEYVGRVPEGILTPREHEALERWSPPPISTIAPTQQLTEAEKINIRGFYSKEFGKGGETFTSLGGVPLFSRDPLGMGGRGTLMYRPLTYAEEIEHRRVQQARAEWFKEERKTLPEDVYSYSELLERGQLPSLVRKGFREVGTAYFGIIGKGVSGVAGTTPLTPSQEELGGELLGNLFLWMFFAPAFKTGAAAQQQVVLGDDEELIYDYVKGIWKKRNKVTGKISRLQATSEFGKIPEERQLKILKQAFTENVDDAGNVLKRVYLDKQSLLKDIGKAKKFMRESGLSETQIDRLINKLFPNIKITAPIIETEGSLLYGIQKVPQMRGLGKLIAGVTSLKEQERLKPETRQKMPGLFRDLTLPKYREAELTGFGLLTGLQQPQLEREKQIETPKLIQPPVTIFKGLTYPGERLQPRQPRKPTAPYKPPKEEEKKPKKPKMIDLLLPRRPGYKKEERIGYDVHYLKEATKPRKRQWIKLNTAPLTQSGALGLGARYVDENISARFKVKPVLETKTIKTEKGIIKKQVPKVFKKPLSSGLDSHYFDIHRHKFREHRIKKGKKIPTPRTFYERKKYRLDRPGEVKKIHYEKKVADLFGLNKMRGGKRQRFRL